MRLEDFIQKKKDVYLRELKEYVSIPSVSTESKHKGDIRRAANWIANRMKKARLENVRQIKTKGNPVVYSDWLRQKGKPTVLFYGHYDVQPPDPLSEWNSDPFKLTTRKGEMFGRGVADNKAPHLSHILGVEALLKTKGELPVNVKFMIEGEEEVGSVNILDVLSEHKRLLSCKIAFVSDSEMDFDSPVVEYGLRGIFGFEIIVSCLKKDAHSGTFGGVVDNPAIVLAYIISKLKDRKGKILIPGIYKKVRRISPSEHKMLVGSENKSQEVLETTGAKKIFGEEGYLNIERTGARPSLDVNGIEGGFTGEGMKTIIPASARAKLTMRLVPNQSVKEMGKLVTSFIKKIAPKTCKVEVEKHGGCDPTLFDWRNSSCRAAKEVLEEVFGAKAKYKLVGGSIGAVDAMNKILGVNVILTGFSLPDCGMHSPNEKFKVENFFKAMEVTTKYLEKLGQ